MRKRILQVLLICMMLMMVSSTVFAANVKLVNKQKKIYSMDYPSGGKYVGQMKNNKPEGIGTEYRRDGSKIYEGQWKNGDWNGKGTYYAVFGEKYVGQFKNGFREGTGTCYYEDGTMYVGQWKRDKREGKGTFYNENGKYVGEFKNDNINGQGTFYFPNGRIYFSGEWKDGVPVNNNKLGQ